MARQRRIVANPAVRGLIRESLRRGSSVQEAVDEAADIFTTQPLDLIEMEAWAEARRQRQVANLMEADKRKSIDLGPRLGCRGKNARARWGITIYWRDPDTQRDHSFNWTGETSVRGRLADLVNQVIGQAVAQAIVKGYAPVKITSANTTGRARYRLNYVECV